MIKIVLQKMTIKRFISCFRNDQYNKYKYLGYISNPYLKGTIEYDLVLDFVKFVDKIAKPKYIPRFVLRLIELFGNDNSIVRVRNWKLHKLSNKLLKNIRITDIKTKWHDHDLRIYGYFPEVISNELDELEQRIYTLSDDAIKERDNC